MGGAAHYPVCFTNPPYELGRKVFPDDLEKAIDAWCIDDAEIKPWGQYGGDGPQYPPKGQPGFYVDDIWASMTIHLALKTVKTGGPDL
jgi:hypothetical protein